MKQESKLIRECFLSRPWSSRRGRGRGAVLFPAALAIAIGFMALTTRGGAAAGTDGNEGFRREVSAAIEKGLAWLGTNQNAAGWWSTADQPAVTGLALMAYHGEPTGRWAQHQAARKGLAFLLQCVQPDGGIHRSNLVTYNTSIALLALAAARQPELEPVIQRGRQFLIQLQRDFGKKGIADTAQDGGVGYGSKYDHSDMGNTLQALEALYHTRRPAADRAPVAEPDLNWAAAIRFLQHCQNLPEFNSEKWASDDPINKGGFIYYPGHSMAGTMTNSDSGRVALRSYGSISYGGLLSYIYADLKKGDPRVTAVFDWIRRNYTLEENPGLGPQGLFYYYHTMAKALSLHGTTELELVDGRKISWRKDLAAKLLKLQQRDGSWVNENGRWWERDPALVTAYGVLTLEIVQRGL
jgi:squalene-hopene/tetraprenyl-beta-curcumene cyclase